jgi:hypothetical protein
MITSAGIERTISPQAVAFQRGRPLLEYLGALAKPKLLLLLIANLPIVALVTLWVVIGAMAVRGYEVMQRPDMPSIPELQQHLEWNDKRLDAVDNDVTKRLDRLEEDRERRRETSDNRYKALSDGLDSVKHDVTFVYGGGIIGTAIVSLLLTLNIVKVRSAESKIDQYKPGFRYKNDPLDIDQAEVLRDYLTEAIRGELDKRDRGRNR